MYHWRMPWYVVPVCVVCHSSMVVQHVHVCNILQLCIHHTYGLGICMDYHTQTHIHLVSMLSCNANIRDQVLQVSHIVYVVSHILYMYLCTDPMAMQSIPYVCIHHTIGGILLHVIVLHAIQHIHMYSMMLCMYLSSYTAYHTYHVMCIRHNTILHVIQMSMLWICIHTSAYHMILCICIRLISCIDTYHIMLCVHHMCMHTEQHVLVPQICSVFIYPH